MIQPRVYELVERAERAADAGRYDEATACLEAVTLRSRVTVSLDMGGLGLGERLQSMMALQTALQNWEEALEGAVTFEFAEGRGADIRVKFAPEVRHLGRQVAGSAVWSRQVYKWDSAGFTAHVRGDIRVRTTDLNGGAMPQDAMVQATMHEIGHIFGLWDSPVVGDVMGPLRVEAPAIKLSHRELSALREVRGEAGRIWALCLSATAQK